MRTALGRIPPAWLLVLFAPVSAEYLIGYDDTIGNPVALVFGLVIFAPLYGAPALLIREVTRRAGRGWPTMLLLGCAFGLVQAGLIDQSLFNPHYRSISYWDNLREPTLVSGAGVSAFMVLSFVGGHMITSVCAPIALAEAMFPGRAARPWVGRSGLVLLVVVWLGAAGYVLADTLNAETFRPSAAQLTVTSLVVVALIGVAFTHPRAESRSASRVAAPSPGLVLGVSALCLGVRPLLDSICARTAAAGGWVPTLLGLGALVVFALLLARWSSRDGWDARHVLAVAAGAFISLSAVAFTVDPIGHVPLTAKLTDNAVLFALVLFLLHAAAVRLRPARPNPTLLGQPHPGDKGAWRTVCARVPSG
jgi:hypothetical protein